MQFADQIFQNTEWLRKENNKVLRVGRKFESHGYYIPQGRIFHW